jgi:hypothetical protein
MLAQLTAKCTRVVVAAALAQHLVLDVVERHLAAQQGHPLRLPGAAQQAAEVLDRLQVGYFVRISSTVKAL